MSKKKVFKIGCPMCGASVTKVSGLTRCTNPKCEHTLQGEMWPYYQGPDVTEDDVDTSIWVLVRGQWRKRLNQDLEPLNFED